MIRTGGSYGICKEDEKDKQNRVGYSKLLNVGKDKKKKYQKELQMYSIGIQ